MKCKVFSFTKECIENQINFWLEDRNIEIISQTQSQVSTIITVVITYKEIDK